MALVEVKVPDIGDFKDVEVIELLVKPGDAVKVEQSLITVESDKASMEIPSSHAGVVKEMKIKLGDRVGEGSLLLVLEADAAAAVPAAPAPAPAAASWTTPPAPPAATPSTRKPPARQTHPAHPRAADSSPAPARRAARSACPSSNARRYRCCHPAAHPRSRA